MLGMRTRSTLPCAGVAAVKPVRLTLTMKHWFVFIAVFDGGTRFVVEGSQLRVETPGAVKRTRLTGRSRMLASALSPSQRNRCLPGGPYTKVAADRIWSDAFGCRYRCAGGFRGRTI